MHHARSLRRRFVAEILLVLGTGVASEACKKSLVEQEQHRMPSCPSGMWCTGGETAKSLSVPDGGTTMSCASAIRWNRSEDAAAPADLPSMYGDGTLDEQQTGKERSKGTAGACCYRWIEPCPGGRPLRSDDVALLAPPGDAEGWRASFPTTPSNEALALDERDRAALADAWLADALAEHASVASFARAAIELLAVGAPAELVASCQRASLDEIEHARLCFALASRLAGRPLGPGALPATSAREPTLEAIVRDTFTEGCVGETIAALSARCALDACTDEATRGVLERIADDEARHAELAWRTVSWALTLGGSSVRRALLLEAQRVRDGDGEDGGGHAPTPDDRTPEDAVLARYGRLGRDEALGVRRAAWSEIIEPALGMLERPDRASARANTEMHTKCSPPT